MDRRSMDSSRPTGPLTRSSRTIRGNDEPEGSSYELQDARSQSFSVDDRSASPTEPSAGEVNRRSSLGLPTQRRPLSTILRRSTGSRDGRPPSCSKPRSTPTAEAGPSSTPRFSRASSFGPVRAESPYQGASGPTHPYAMYSQDTNMSRTASVATASTVRRPERPYTGPSGPMQPYGMYAQNTVSEEDSDPFQGSRDAIDNSYPAGSRPAPQLYHRRIGPDGEDLDDLIGPDGYAEQLPPYSRYPNDIPPKRDPDASSFVNAPAPSSGPAHYSTPNPTNQNSEAGALPPVTTQNVSRSTLTPETPAGQTQANAQPPFEGPAAAQEPVVQTPQSNPFSDTSTQDSANTAVESGKPRSREEKLSFTKRAQKPLRKRICWGVLPCWLLLVLILTCLAIMLGGIIGGVLAHDQGVRAGAQHAQMSSPTSTRAQASAITVTSIVPAQTPYDAEPLTTTSTSLSALPTGTFAVTLDEPWTTTNSCLSSPEQNNAWDCSTGASLSISIGIQDSEPYVTLTYPPRIGGNKLQYGAQPPQLPGASSLLYMKDKSAMALKRGPAYAFQQPIDKIVLVRAEDFPGALAKRALWKRVKRWLGRKRVEADIPSLIKARDYVGNRQSDWNMTNYASPTDRPWKCVWGGTLLSGFIYVTQNVDEQAQYPRSMKLAEKRAKTNRSKATCQQMTIAPNLELVPLKKEDGSFNIVTLDELSPATLADGTDEYDYDSESQQPSSRIRRRDSPQTGDGCECVWQST